MRDNKEFKNIGKPGVRKGEVTPLVKGISPTR